MTLGAIYSDEIVFYNLAAGIALKMVQGCKMLTNGPKSPLWVISVSEACSHLLVCLKYLLLHL